MVKLKQLQKRIGGTVIVSQKGVPVLFVKNIHVAFIDNKYKTYQLNKDNKYDIQNFDDVYAIQEFIEKL